MYTYQKYVYFTITIQFTEKNLLKEKLLCLKPSLEDRIIHVNLTPLAPFHDHQLKAAPLLLLWELLKPYNKKQTSFLPVPYNFFPGTVQSPVSFYTTRSAVAG